LYQFFFTSKQALKKLDQQALKKLDQTNFLFKVKWVRWVNYEVGEVGEL